MSDQKPPHDLAIGEPIAIVGIGCMFPQAPDLNAYWRNIKSSRDTITDIPASHWNPDDYFDADPSAPDMTYARRGGFLDPVAFHPLHYGIAPNTIEATDSTQLLTLMAAEQALTNAGYAVRESSNSGRTFDRSRTSVMLGVTGTLELVIPLGARLGHPLWRKAMLDAGIPSATTEEIITRIAAGYVPWQEQSFPGLLGNVTAGRIANRLDLGGANCVVDAACASSLSAIHMAAMELALGRCDMAISGGVDTFNDIFMYMCFSKTPALSASGDARPFSADADGTMLGEGIGVVVLKRLSDARRDGDQIQAIIKGIGASSDGAGNAIYAPSSSGQSRALRAAYREAGIRPRTIELVEAHGTGTRVGDQVEANALSAVFSEDLIDDDQSGSKPAGDYHSWCALGSVKSMIGHTKAAAGVAGLIKTVLALQHKVLPPTLKIDQPLESLTPGRSPMYLNTRARPWIAQAAHPRRAAVSAFGFGGSNFHCVLEEAHADKRAPDWSGDLQLLAFSGDTCEAVHEQLAALQQAIAPADAQGATSPRTSPWDEVRRQAALSREHFAGSAACRFVFLLSADQLNDASLFTRLQDAARPQAPANNPGLRCFYGEGKPGGRLGFVFPGQGSQRTDMLLDLSCQFPAMLERWQQADARLANAADPVRLSERVYPLPVFAAEQIREQREALRATRIAQPALAAASLGMLDVLADFDLRADAFAGHSFGEFVALYAAGAITDDTLLHLARQRGECMEVACEQTRGSMLAVNADLATVEAALATQSLTLAIANHNSPSQVVLSGAIDELDRARDLFSAQGLHPVPLNVAGAFHSPLMDPARKRFARCLDDADFAAPSQPVYSNVSAAPYPLDAAQIRELLSSQITAPVRFVDMIRNMYDEGIHTFVEVGPGKVLQSLIGAILGDQPHQVIALDASAGQTAELGDLGASLAQLAAIGHHIDLQQWDPAPPAAQTIEGFSIEISGANHFQRKELPTMQHRLNLTEGQNAHVAPDARQALAPAPALARTPALTPAPPIPAADPPAAATFTARAPITSGTDMDLIQSTLLALQKMQQQTSDLHRQYLESQQAAQRSIELLIRQQLQTNDGPLATAAGDSSTSTGDAPTGLATQATPATPAPAPRAEVATAPAQSVASLPTHDAQLVMQTLLQIVAEKTGYPLDVLTPEMSLDGDLGIDSIKRVEIFSSLSDHFPSLATLSADEAGSLDTLQQIEARLSVDATPTALAPTPPKAGPAPAATPHADMLPAIIAVIAEKTGYPSEALSLEMRLDEDLGIDSIKRVEILSALQDEFPNLPALEADAVGSLQTIAEIALLLGQGSGDAESPSGTATATEAMMPTPARAVPNKHSDAAQQIRDVIADKTGYPAAMLDSDMQLDTDLGIDSIKRVEIFSVLQEQFPHAPVVEPDAMAGLQSIGDIINYLDGSSAPQRGADPSSPATAAALDESGGDAGLHVREVIAEKTGYPTAMLESGMQLDVDLGIDSIKRVEIFSVLQEQFPHAPVVEPDAMASLQSIGDIIDYLGGGSTASKAHGDGVKGTNGARGANGSNGRNGGNGGNGGAHHEAQDTTQGAAVHSAPMSLPTGAGNLEQGLHRLILSSTSLDDTARQGMPMPADAVIGIVAEATPLAEALRLAFEARGIFSKLISTAHKLTEASVTGLLIVAPKQMSTDTLAQAFAQLRAYGPQLQRAATRAPALLACVSRLNGQFGLRTAQDSAPIDQAMSAGLGGLVKTAAREWPDLCCKSIDVSASWESDQELANAIVTEVLLAGPLEVGLSPHGASTLQLGAQNLPAPARAAQPLLKPSELVLVSGGARGISAAIAIALAQQFQPTLLLIGRSPEPAREAQWLHGLDTETAIKQAIHQHHASAKSPKEIEKVYRRTIANREMLASLATIKASGAKALYRSVDIRDQNALRNTLHEITTEHGPLRGIVHGAGVIADALIADKTEQQFAAVMSTKCEGFINLLACLEDPQPAFIVACSSTTARLGRRGQADYAAANECLNKLSQQAACQYPHSKVLSVNWGPWNGGMVDARLRSVFKKEGVGLIPMDAGARYLLDELQSAPSPTVELVILGPTPDQGPSCPAAQVLVGKDPHAMADPQTDLHLCFSQQVNLAAMPILGAHVINGRAVVPVALIIEWLAHGALHASPGLRFTGLEDLRILKGITIDAQQSLNIQVLAGATERQQTTHGLIEIISMEVRSDDQLHARARIHLGESYANATARAPAIKRAAYARQPYAPGRLFHGAPLQGITRISGCDEHGISGESNAAPPPLQWIRNPLRKQWLADPLILDASFQMLILWAEHVYGHGSLPTAIARLELYAPFPARQLIIDAQVQDHQASRARARIDFVDHEGVLIARIEDYECVIDVSLKTSFSRNTLDGHA